MRQRGRVRRAPRRRGSAVVVAPGARQERVDAEPGDVGLNTLGVAQRVPESSGQRLRPADTPNCPRDDLEVERPLGLQGTDSPFQRLAAFTKKRRWAGHCHHRPLLVRDPLKARQVSMSPVVDQPVPSANALIAGSTVVQRLSLAGGCRASFRSYDRAKRSLDGDGPEPAAGRGRRPLEWSCGCRGSGPTRRSRWPRRGRAQTPTTAIIRSE